MIEKFQLKPICIQNDSKATRSSDVDIVVHNAEEQTTKSSYLDVECHLVSGVSDEGS